MADDLPRLQRAREVGDRDGDRGVRGGARGRLEAPALVGSEDARARRAAVRAHQAAPRAREARQAALDTLLATAKIDAEPLVRFLLRQAPSVAVDASRRRVRPRCRARAGAPGAAAIARNDYALELFQGPLLAPGRDHRARRRDDGDAQALEGVYNNAAAPAVREPQSLDHFEWEPTAGISFPGAYGGTDFNNRGEKGIEQQIERNGRLGLARPSTVETTDRFLYLNAGLWGQLGNFGLTVTADIAALRRRGADRAPSPSRRRRHHAFPCVRRLRLLPPKPALRRRGRPHGVRRHQ